MIDPHGEYGAAFADTGALFDVANLALPYWLLNLDEHAEIFVTAHGPEGQIDRDILAKCLLAARAKNRASEGLTRLTADAPVPYLLSDLVGIVNAEMGKLDKSGVGSAPYLRLKSRIEEIRADPRYAFMFSGMLVADSMADTLGRLFRLPGEGKPIAIVDLSGVPSEITAVVVAMLARLIFDHAIWSRGADQRPVLLVCEEAHRYVPQQGRSPARPMLERIAKEGRKYGVALGLVTQRPSDLAEGVLSQCGTIISMRLNNDRDQAFVRAAVPEGAGGLIDAIPALRNREAVAVGEAVPIPIRIRFDNAGRGTRRPASSDPSFTTAWRGTTEADDRPRMDRTIKRWRAQDDRFSKGRQFLRLRTPSRCRGEPQAIGRNPDVLHDAHGPRRRQAPRRPRRRREVRDGMFVGLGTGSTAAFLIEELGPARGGRPAHRRRWPRRRPARRWRRPPGSSVRDRSSDCRSIDLASTAPTRSTAGSARHQGCGWCHAAGKGRRRVRPPDGGDRRRQQAGRRDLGAVPLPVEVLPFARSLRRRGGSRTSSAPHRCCAWRGALPTAPIRAISCLDCRFASFPDPACWRHTSSAIPGCWGTACSSTRSTRPTSRMRAGLSGSSGTPLEDRNPSPFGPLPARPDRMANAPFRHRERNASCPPSSDTMDHASHAQVREDGSLDRLAIDTIRTLAMDAVQKANSAAIPERRWRSPRSARRCGPSSCATIPHTRIGPIATDFVLSVGHASMLLYGLIHMAGIEEIDADGNKTGPRGDQPGRYRAVSPALVQDTGPPRISAHHRRRDHHRPARPGLRQFGGHGDRRALARGPLQSRRLHAVRP